MGQYTFKSVGQTQTQTKTNKAITSAMPVGIITPPRPADDGSLIQVTYTLADQIRYNLHDLLLTNWGERLGLYDFGANLKPLCSEYQTQDDFDTAAMDRIRTAITKWMPYVELEDFASEIEKQPTSKQTYITRRVKITITYSVSQLGIQRQALEIAMNVL
jgi:phage baseplate assembly protein W